MKTRFFMLFFVCSIVLCAQEKLYIHNQDKTTLGVWLADVSEMTFSADGSSFFLNMEDETPEFRIAEIDSLTFGDDSKEINIYYNETGVYFVNPLAFEGVSVTAEGGNITVTSTIKDEVRYTLHGTTTNGSFKIYSDSKFAVYLDNAAITNTDGAALNIQSKKQATIFTTANSVNELTDGNEYIIPDGEKMKANIYSKGAIVFDGKGSLTIHANKKTAVACSEVTINNGKLIVNVTEDSGKAINADDGVTINGGNIHITTSGNVILEENDPSYCTAIKTDGNVIMNDGALTIVSTGKAGKGISADGDISINEGTIHISTSGDGNTYTNTDNEPDSYSATCIKADGNITIMGGEITVNSSGSAGKGISVDGAIVIGDDTHAPIINATTTGKKFLESGSGMNANYANPKAIKSTGNLTVNNGIITLKTTQDGGEGLESKATLTINGGIIEANTYDDAINASTAININGGKIYCYSSGNDGIDSNGTLTITGGLVIASGATSPEDGFDCDQNTFTITGGTVIGIGGGTSTPTSSVCTQRSVIYGGNGTANTLIHIQDANGNEMMTYTIPRNYNQQMTLLFSSTDLIANGSYTIYTGGTYNGGTEFNGYLTGGTYTAGTQAATFTATSMVTNVGSSSGGRPGGGENPPGGGGRP